MDVTSAPYKTQTQPDLSHRPPTRPASNRATACQSHERANRRLKILSMTHRVRHTVDHGIGAFSLANRLDQYRSRLLEFV